MKKTFLIISTLLALCTASLFAGEKHEEMWSDMTYQNVPIMKILEAKDAYVVIYQKNKIGVANTVIPKAWAQGNPDEPRKLKFRKVRRAVDSYMTVVKKGGEFQRVILNIPLSKHNSVWGVADYHKEIEGSDKETLEELEL